jgi:predicted glycogen debranching enzyme
VAVADEKEESAKAIMGTMPATIENVNTLLGKETERCADSLGKFHMDHKGAMSNTVDWLDWLVLAADAFVVRTANRQKSVIAGYFWFDSWGRDTFISLPGLLLVTGRFGEARQIFLEFRDHCRNGLIPNVFGDESHEPIFNSVDASLWFVNAALQYVKYTGDFRFVRNELWETLKGVIDTYSRGTLFGIHVDGDRLVSHGAGLTWMDARVGGIPVTPRAGKAVEIQALWYNALRTMELFAEKFGQDAAANGYGDIAERAKSSFNRMFWNGEKGCLFDVLADGGADESLRPNQVFAVSVDFPILDQSKMESVVDFVQREFLTPVGLRTLSKGDSRYAGVYAGDRMTRDKAYHNGTVWPFLLGPFVRAYLHVKGYSDVNRKRVLTDFLSPLLRDRLHDLGVGTICEVFDGDFPYRAGGCVAQAWSVAEVLRTYVEDVLQFKPKFEKEVLKY